MNLTARTQLNAEEKTVEDRKARAALDSAEAFFEAEVAEVLVDACVKSLFVLKDDWDTCSRSGRTNGPNVTRQKGSDLEHRDDP